MNKINKIVKLLDKNEQKKASLILMMVIFMALINAMGVASVMPFLAVIAKPEVMVTNDFLLKVKTFLNIKETRDFVYALGLASFILLLFSMIFQAVTTRMMLKFILTREYSIGKKLFAGYLMQPYKWYLNKNSSDLSKNIISEVKEIVDRALMPTMILISQLIVTMSLISLLLIANAELTIMVGISLGGAYYFIFKIMNKHMSKIGDDRLKSNEARFKVINEALGGIKEVKFQSLEEIYLKKFDGPSLVYANQQANVQVTSQLPRYALEAVAFGGMILIIIYLMGVNNDISELLPIISLYAFVGYRLMPALQQIYSSLTQLKYAEPAIDRLYKELDNLKVELKEVKIEGINEINDFNDKIKIESIKFKYPYSTIYSLNDISMEVKVKTSVAVVGKTGSGKTTLADIILGLLNPDHGRILIDGKELSPNNIRQWRSMLGYVPQQIYLTDTTLASNIAFGVEKEKIELKRVIEASKIANLHEYVEANLPEKYDTIVGERGVRLSGGQRQRIAIARALYKNPKIIIMDEATSALDNLTEQAVMDAVKTLSNKVTLIIIAHRLSTIKECDNIVIIDKGRVEDEGSYQDLLLRNENFRKMNKI